MALGFHGRCHGSNIVLTENGTVATRKNPRIYPGIYDQGIVFGDRPVKKGEMVTIEIISLPDSRWADAFSFGFTNRDPGEIDRHSLPSRLLDLDATWVQRPPTEEVSKQGNKFSYFYTDDDVNCLINGKPWPRKGVSTNVCFKQAVPVNIQKDMWPLFDVHGQTTSVKISVEPAGGISWSEADVQDWLKENKLDDLCDTMKGYNGIHLLEMSKKYCDEREEFEKDMKSDHQMNSRLYLDFSVALEKLFK